MAKKITTGQLDGLKTINKVLSESLPVHGSLIARRLSKRIGFYYQYNVGEIQRRYPFGNYSKEGNRTGEETAAEYTLAGARLRAFALASIWGNHGDVIEHMDHQRRESERARQQVDREQVIRKQDAEKYSFENLCRSYWRHLKAERKTSAKDVENKLTKWVIKNNREIAKQKASEVTTEDVMTILRSIIAEGITTTTNRVRSHINAAYNFGIGSATDPLTASRADGFSLTFNPAAAIKPVKQFEKKGERTLSDVELAKFLKILDSKQTPASKTIMLSLRFGGQRISQLLRATLKQYNTDQQVLTLYDPKGNRDEPRTHYLPVINNVQSLLLDALANPNPRRPGLYKGLTLDTCSKLVQEIRDDIVKKTKCEAFTWRDLRRTCETMLAAMRMSKDIRAQILSHGITGIQDQVYDKHDYLDQKKAVLESWNARLDELLTGDPMENNVTDISTVARK